MTAARPFRSPQTLLARAEREWAKASRQDVLEALSHHPRIGDRESLLARFPTTHGWSAAEQRGAAEADEQVLTQLSEGNRDYEIRFGHVFVVCASGLSGPEMLALLRTRLGHGPEEELKIAASEQLKITRLRLEKLLQEKAASGVSA